MVVNERCVAEITSGVILVFVMPMIVDLMSVIAMVSVSHSALVIMPNLVRRPCHSRHDKGAYEQKKGGYSEHT